jgi:hypothetical protein
VLRAADFAAHHLVNQADRRPDAVRQIGLAKAQVGHARLDARQPLDRDFQCLRLHGLASRLQLYDIFRSHGSNPPCGIN